MTTETRTGFLGSGWSSESELPDSSKESTPFDPWPEDEERPGGRIRKTVLVVAAVAVVLGGTVVGVRALAGSESPAGCPPAGCVAAASNQPVPEADTSDEPAAEDPSEEPAPDDEPSEETGDETPRPGDQRTRSTPAPDRTSTRGGGEGTSTPRPTPTRKATRAPVDTDESSTSEESADEPTSTPEPLIVSERTPAPEPPPSSSPGPDPVPSETASSAAPLAGGAAITVGADIVQERSRTYTVELVVAANESVEYLQVSVPVSGEVTSVSGADWEQAGDSLLIESPEGLEVDEELVVTFTASGDAEIPQSCRSDQGECAVA
ncbi:hypothetical protein AB0F88_33900 [Streptosporangium sp. NPDC023963]|uniref:hypothetical protein n=1 Tax=Streptosporangium sp. NPDC023963 TaxID=3155608 RepID=UPI0034473AA8